MRSVHPNADEAPHPIGARLRSTRIDRGLTLEQLAQASGVTKGFLSRVERDATSPSVATLVQLCQVLSLPVGALFEEPLIQRVSLADAPAISMGGTGVTERLITSRAESRVQVIRSSMRPGADGGAQLYTVGSDVDVLHLISGELTLRFVGREERLAAGDTVTFPGREPHTWVAGPNGAEAVWTLIPATWSEAGGAA